MSPNDGAASVLPQARIRCVNARFASQFVLPLSPSGLHNEYLADVPRNRSVRYCDEKCQLEDYRVRHKRECGRFVTPPLTRAFLTQSTGNDTIYPKHPVFAKGYHDGVGCWVSHEGRPDFG